MIGPIVISIPTCIAVAAASGAAAFVRALLVVVLVVVLVVIAVVVVVVCFVDVGVRGARWPYVVPATRAAAGPHEISPRLHPSACPAISIMIAPSLSLIPIPVLISIPSSVVAVAHC